MASERPGVSSCLSAHLSTVSRNSFDSRIAVTGSRPVAGRPRPFFGTTLFDFAIKCSTVKAGRGEAYERNFHSALTPNHEGRIKMAKAKTRHSTPPINTSAIDAPRSTVNRAAEDQSSAPSPRSTRRCNREDPRRRHQRRSIALFSKESRCSNSTESDHGNPCGPDRG
jgi:hypothetical protein